MRYLCLCFVLMINLLEVAAQQLPKEFECTSEYLRIDKTLYDENFKVVRGQYLNYEQIKDKHGIIGKIQKENSHIIFRPLVPFDLDTDYTFLSKSHIIPFRLENEADKQSLQVTHIFPSTDEIPANILKWYILFSKPVNPIKIYDHIQFLDDNNNVIDRSILNLGAPLLSSDGMLLTVWIEPGRQKRDLGPNQHLGSVFEPSKKYTLLIANTLKDTQGNTIQESYTHKFTSYQADRKKLSIDDFHPMPIHANTQQTLEVKCKEQLDYGSLIDAFSIYYENKLVDGKVSFDYQTKSIKFTPFSIWKKGTYTLIFESQLEDLAGNNFLHLFDRPVQEDSNTAPKQSFTIKLDCQ